MKQSDKNIRKSLKEMYESDNWDISPTLAANKKGEWRFVIKELTIPLSNNEFYCLHCKASRIYSLVKEIPICYCQSHQKEFALE